MNNIVRVTLAALSAVLGSAQTLHTSSFDEAFATPTEQASGIAVRTQQVIMEESGLTGTADPLGGSWALEALTADIERSVHALIAEIEERGGALVCIEDGWFKSRLEESAYVHQLAIERGERRIVGVNVYRTEGDELAPTHFAVDPESERRQLANLARVRAERDAGAVASVLERLRGAASEGVNTVPATIDAVRAYATVGEITDALRGVLGTYSSQHGRLPPAGARG